MNAKVLRTFHLAAALVAATAAGAAPPLSAFVYASKADVFGYYLPKTDIQAGRFKLHDLVIGGRDDFRKFLAGRRIATYAPVMIEFDDVTSKQRTNEMGQPYYENAPRVLPASFKVDGLSVTFTGDDKQLGHVAFAGTLARYMVDPGVSVDARAVMGQAPLTGDLLIGGKTFKNVMFTWFGGD